MRILLIGNQTLTTDALHALLSQNDDCEVNRISLYNLNGQDSASVVPSFDLSVMDFDSLSVNRVEAVHFVANGQYARHLLVVHRNIPEEQCQSLCRAGADRCISLEQSTDELWTAIMELGSS